MRLVEHNIVAGANMAANSNTARDQSELDVLLARSPAAKRAYLRQMAAVNFQARLANPPPQQNVQIHC